MNKAIVTLVVAALALGGCGWFKLPPADPTFKPCPTGTMKDFRGDCIDTGATPSDGPGDAGAAAAPGPQ